MTLTLKVHIENYYEDGHESTSDELVEAPGPGESLEDWWEDVVFPLTGDGHGENMNSSYTATIIEADPANAHLVGQSNEWG
jgi:hypothetical protein